MGVGDSEQRGKARRKKSRRRTILISLLVLLGVVIVAVVFAPWIISPYARSVIESKGSNAIPGDVDASSVQLSWLGPQRVRGLEIRDAAGNQVAKVDVRVQAGLLGLAFGNRDLGTITISGSATIARDEKGELNLTKALVRKTTPGPHGSTTGGGGGGLPPSLHATVVLDNLSVGYRDPALAEQGLSSVSLQSINGRTDIRAGQTINVQVSALVSGQGADGATFDAGTFKINGDVQGLISSNGSIEPDAAELDITAQSDDLDPALADRLVSAPVAFEQAFGSKVQVVAHATGPLTQPGGSFEISSKNINASGAATFDGADLTLTQALTASLTADAVAAVDRQWLSHVTGGSLDVTAMPSINLRIADARVPLGPSLARAAGDMQLKVGTLNAVVTVGEGDTAMTRVIHTEPATLTVASESLEQGLGLGADVAFDVDGKDGGTLTADVLASSLFDESGRFSKRMPVVQGQVALDGVDTAVLQPFVAAAGVNMSTDVGPTLDVAVNLQPQGGGDITLVDASVDSENINGGVHLILEETQVRSADPAGQLRIGAAGPLLSRMLRQEGLDVREGGRVEVTLQAATVDLGHVLAGEPFEPGDVPIARVELTLGPTAGLIQAGEENHTFRLEQLGGLLSFFGDSGSMQLRMATGCSFDGRPAGQANAEMRIDQIIGGGWSIGIPAAVLGRAEFNGISTQLAEPFIAESAVSAGEIFGPTVDLTMDAAPAGEGQTKLTVALTSETTTGDGALLFSQQAIAVGPEGFTLSHTGLAPELAALLPTGEAATIRSEGGSVEANISRLILPLDPQTRAPKLEQLDAAMRVEVRNVFLDRPEVDPGDQLELRQLVVNGRIKPNEPASARVATTMYAQREQVRGEGAFTAAGLNDALAGRGAWTPASLKPEGSMTFAEIPAALLAEALRFVPLEGLDANAIAQDVAGQSFKTVFALEPQPDAVQSTLTVTGDKLNINSSATFGQTLTRARASGEVRLSRPSTENLMRAALPNMSDTISVVGATAIRFDSSLTDSSDVKAALTIPAMTLRGLDQQDLRIGIGCDVSTTLPSAGKGQATPMAANFNLAVQSPDRTQIASAAGNVRIGAEGAPVEGTIEASGLRTAWADRLLGTTDLYQGALGEQVGISATAAVEAGKTKINATVQAPALLKASPLAATLDRGAIMIDKPFSATWRGNQAWLNDRLQRSLAENAPTIDRPLDVQVVVRSLSLPGEEAIEGVSFSLDAAATVPQLDLTMPGGGTRSYRQVQMTLRENKEGTGVVAQTRGDVSIAGGASARAININAEVHDLVAGGVLTPDTAFLDANGSIEHVPTSLVDALAGMDGWLTRMLGQEVAIDKLAVTRAPLEGGTAMLDLSSPTSRAHFAGTFKDDKNDGQLIDGAFVVQNGSYLELNQLEESFTRDLFNVVPILGKLQRDPGAEQPSRIDIRSARVPLSGDVQKLAFDASADLGSVRYSLSGPLEDVLKRTGQNSFGELGARLQPFDIAMADGVIHYQDLTVPVGEFTFASQGDVNILQKTKDVVLLVPFGAFVNEALDLPAPVGKLLDRAANIPIVNQGPLDSKQWKPDFSKGATNLKPGDLLQGILNRRDQGDKP